MKLYFFRGLAPNFGDELNEWLLPKVFPDFFDDDPADLFLGIGSVLLDTHPKDVRKIVFGTGFGGYTSAPHLDDTWKIYGVRGPLTAEALGLSKEAVAGDAAILINRYRPAPKQKKYPVSFMPHFYSIPRGHWMAVCRLAGIHFIDPRLPVEKVLDEIEQSSILISEAMHGVIVADALRVPWISVRPFDPVHHMKWRDWAGALDLDLKSVRLLPSSLREFWIAHKSAGGPRTQSSSSSSSRANTNSPSFRAGIGGAAKKATRVVDPAFIAIATVSLKKAAQHSPSLSSDSALNRVLDRLESDALKIQRDFAQAR